MSIRQPSIVNEIKMIEKELLQLKTAQVMGSGNIKTYDISSGSAYLFASVPRVLHMFVRNYHINVCLQTSMEVEASGDDYQLSTGFTEYQFDSDVATARKNKVFYFFAIVNSGEVEVEINTKATSAGNGTINSWNTTL